MLTQIRHNNNIQIFPFFVGILKTAYMLYPQKLFPIILSILTTCLNANPKDQDHHKPGAVDHLRGGLHCTHAEGEHRAQERNACEPVQADLHGPADGRDEEVAGLQDQCWVIHHHGAFPPRRMIYQPYYAYVPLLFKRTHNITSY